MRRGQPAVRDCGRRNPWCEGVLGRAQWCEERVTRCEGQFGGAGKG